MIIVALVKTRERFIGTGQVLTMPLFFASNAIYPIDIMLRAPGPRERSEMKTAILEVEA